MQKPEPIIRDDGQGGGIGMDEGKWWLQPQRMVQTNLREIDADLDLSRYFDELRALKTTVLLFNTGGIVANYHTELPFHYPNPHLPAGRDLVGEVLERCHEHGIRYLARFDFSKANRAFYSQHPEWFYRKSDNSVVDYNGQMHTCVNGNYQRQHSLAIVAEVLDRYPIDGMFFNMFGYQTTDYSRNYHGLCYCEGCRAAFKEYSGHDLPRNEDPADPVYRQHQRFRRQAAADMRQRIIDLARDRRPDDLLIAGDNLVRRESNTSLYRSLPRWVYRSSDQVKQVVDAQDGRAVANAAVHFVDFPYRHASVPPQQTALRLAQNMANGGWLDFYCIGPLERQQDRAALRHVHDLYSYHEKHADTHYTGLRPAANVALMAMGGEEYRGMYRILAESHRPFTVLTPETLSAGDARDRLASFALVVVPDGGKLSPELDDALDDYVAAGGRLLLTGRLPVGGRTGSTAAEGDVRVPALGVEEVVAHRTEIRSANLQVRDRKPWKHLGTDVDLILVDHYFQHLRPRPKVQTLLRLIPPCMFGPPEKCYYEQVTDEPGILSYAYGQGRSSVIPWPIGRLYYELSLPPHRHLVLDVVDHVLGTPLQLETNASPMVEVSMHSQRREPGRTIIHLVNSSGHHGTAFHAPVTMSDISVTLHRDQPVGRVYSLRLERELPYRMENGSCTIMVPSLTLFDAVIVDAPKA